jgi:hypothetical protein
VGHYAGGVPTGAVIERGANANGEYVRFSDGTQVCTKTLTGLGPANIALGNVFRSALISFGSWAATFSAVPTVATTAMGPTDGGWQHVWVTQARLPTATGPVEGALLRATSTDLTTFSIQFVAVGRWF